MIYSIFTFWDSKNKEANGRRGGRPGPRDPNPDSTLRPLVAWFLEHTTERIVRIWEQHQGLPDGAERFDVFIRNDGSIEQLAEGADAFVETVSDGRPPP